MMYIMDTQETMAELSWNEQRKRSHIILFYLWNPLVALCSPGLIFQVCFCLNQSPKVLSNVFWLSFKIWINPKTTLIAYMLLLLSASVVSNSVAPHRRQLTRLPHPWDSPGKNTGVGCHCLLQTVYIESLIHIYGLSYFLNSQKMEERWNSYGIKIHLATGSLCTICPPAIHWIQTLMT